MIDDDCDFATPPSTPPLASYLSGSEPTKVDFDVFTALTEWAGADAVINRLRAYPAVLRLVMFWKWQNRLAEDSKGDDSKSAFSWVIGI